MWYVRDVLYAVLYVRVNGVNSSIQDRRQVDRGFYGVESVVHGNADSLLNSAADHRTRLRPTTSAVSPRR